MLGEPSRVNILKSLEWQWEEERKKLSKNSRPRTNQFTPPPPPQRRLERGDQAYTSRFHGIRPIILSQVSVLLLFWLISYPCKCRRIILMFHKKIIDVWDKLWKLQNINHVIMISLLDLDWWTRNLCLVEIGIWISMEFMCKI